MEETWIPHMTASTCACDFHGKLMVSSLYTTISSQILADAMQPGLHLHFCELFGGDEWFVSVNVLFAGDLLQLPPVFTMTQYKYKYELKEKTILPFVN